MTLRRWLARQLFQWSYRVYEEWHEIALIGPDGTKIEFCCYWDFTGSWPDGWEFSCSCEQTSN